MNTCPISVRPGQVIGHVNGRAVYAIAGGSAPLPGGDPAAPPAPTPPAMPLAPLPGPPAAQPGAPAAPAPVATPPEPKTDLSALPADVRKVIEDARAEAARYRTERTTATQEAQAAKAQRDAVLKALGLNADGTDNVDPAQAAEEATNRAWVAEVSLAIHTSAGRLGADAGKLLDSMSFLDSLDQHVNTQPGNPEFAKQVDAAITAAITANPSYKAGAAVPPASGTQLPGTPGERPTRPTSIADAIRKRHGA